MSFNVRDVLVEVGALVLNSGRIEAKVPFTKRRTKIYLSDKFICRDLIYRTDKNLKYIYLSRSYKIHT